MRWIDTLRYAEEAGASDRDPSTEETVINMPRQDFTRLLNGPPSEDEHELAEHVKQRQIALAVAYAAAARAR
jgi:hypothetical protein